MTQNVIRKDPKGSGNLVVKKLVTFMKPASRFSPGEEVPAELTPNGDIVVDDVERWTRAKQVAAPTARNRRRKSRHRVA